MYLTKAIWREALEFHRTVCTVMIYLISYLIQKVLKGNYEE
jgi:hypothetical protein